MSSEQKEISQRVKRFFGISLLMLIIGIPKVYTEGIYDDEGNVFWLRIMAPFGLGVLGLLYSVVLYVSERREG